jgi:hypothetical protein
LYVSYLFFSLLTLVIVKPTLSSPTRHTMGKVAYNEQRETAQKRNQKIWRKQLQGVFYSIYPLLHFHFSLLTLFIVKHNLSSVQWRQTSKETFIGVFSFFSRLFVLFFSLLTLFIVKHDLPLVQRRQTSKEKRSKKKGVTTSPMFVGVFPFFLVICFLFSLLTLSILEHDLSSDFGTAIKRVKRNGPKKTGVNTFIGVFSFFFRLSVFFFLY